MNPATSPIKLMIVDDSITFRMILRNVVYKIPNTDVVTTANNGEDALEKLKSNPVDMVLLDIEMPKMNGLETLQALKKLYPHIGVVMVSGYNRSSADVTIQALEYGAMDFVRKPDGDGAQENERELIQKLAPIFEHFRTQKTRPKAPMPLARPPQAPLSKSPVSGPLSTAQAQSAVITPAATKVSSPTPVSPARRTFGRQTIEVIGLGISTGGPKALMELIPKLPGNLGVPILLVQHMPPVFTASLASSLNQKSALTVKEAEEGERIQANIVYIAPGGYHMAVRRGAGLQSQDVFVTLNQDPPENSCRPSVDVLFRAMAQAYTPQNVLSVIMTGMGNDGAEGVRILKSKGSPICLTQSESTCVVYGMPRAVDEMGLSDERLDLSILPSRIVSLVQS